MAGGCHRILGIFVQNLDDLKPFEALVAAIRRLAKSFKFSDSASKSKLRGAYCEDRVRPESQEAVDLLFSPRI